MVAKIFAKMRIRRGLQADLPNPLTGSEFGHSIDQRRIYIGNGSLSDGAPVVGNTELLTQYSPNFQLLQYNYISNTLTIAQTGLTLATPVYRSLQAVLDDHVSVLDYGADNSGGIDSSEAINRALLDLYTRPLAPGQLAQSQRRVLFFPAGVYLIIANKIVFPPHCILQGEGKNATQFILDSTSLLSHLFQTCDGLGQTDSSIGTNSAELPTDITVNDIGFIREVYGALGQLDRCNTLNFNRCLFNSLWATSLSGSNIFDISALGSIVTMNNFNFNECEFSHFYDLFTLTGASGSTDFFLHNCYIHDSYRGVYGNNSISNVKILDSRFENIEDRGIYGNDSATAMISKGNTFYNVGNTNNVAVIEYTSAAISCSTVSDSFNTVYANPINNSVTGLTQNSSGNGLFQNVIYSSRIGPITLTDNTTNGSTGLVLSIASVLGLFIDYVLIRNGDYRIGRIHITTDGSSNAYIYDENNENSPSSGTVFSLSVGSGNISMLYTTTSTGNNATLYYSYRYF